MKDLEIKFPKDLIDEKLEIAYIGMLHNNPKGISMFYLDIKECQFSVPKMMDLYKLVLFREGQAYASEAAKTGFSFPKMTDEIPKLIKVCKDYAASLQVPIDDIFVKIKKLFLLKKAYAYAPTETVQKKVVDIKNYSRYNEMTIAEIETRVNNLSFLSSMNEAVINQGATNFLLSGNNNLTTGLDLPFPILTRTFKGFRKGETASFAMPSNSGKSRFICNMIAYLVFVEKKSVLLVSNEMTEDKMRLCLTTTIINSEAIQKLHGQKLKKREAELLALKFRPDEDKKVDVDKDGFIIWDQEKEPREDYLKRLSEVSEEFRKTVLATDWISNYLDASLHFVHTADHTNDELRNIILDYYYKAGIEYYFYDTLKTDIENIGNLEELKKTATVLSNLAQKFNVFIGSTLQLAESATPPLSMNINDIAGSRTVKEVLDNLCLIKEINNTTYDKYEVSDEEDSDSYHDLEKPDVSNTKYYACVVDKNRAGAKPKVLFRLNLDYNYWEEMGYLRLKQQ